MSGHIEIVLHSLNCPNFHYQKKCCSSAYIWENRKPSINKE